MNQSPHMHDIDLGPPLDQAAIVKLMLDTQGTELMRAVLQVIRRASADCNRLTQQCSANTMRKAGEVVLNNDNPVFHAGAAAGLEDLFWTLRDPAQA